MEQLAERRLQKAAKAKRPLTVEPPHSAVEFPNQRGSCNNVLMPAPSLCVRCREQPVDPRWRPFCSEHCKMADLGNWLLGNYRVPAADSSTDEDHDDPD